MNKSENKPVRTRQCRTVRRGFTLVELSVSVVSTSVLMAGIASSIMIATKAASTNNMSNAAVTTSLAAAEMMSELATAKSFQERTATAVTFQVGDRDGNSTDETIRYTWSGVGGAPLLRYYNGTSAIAAESVYSFALSYTTQLTQVKRRILFVTGNVTGTRARFDGNRRDLIHGWGFEVIPFVITAATTQSEVNALLAVVDGVYISGTVDAADAGTKFTAAPIGVLIEKAELFDAFKLYTVDGSTFSGHEVNVDIITHYITAMFDVGKIDIVNSNPLLNTFDNSNNLASGTVKLCKQPTGSKFTVVVIEKGGTLTDATPASGRRVTMPWGTIDFDPTLLKNDGKTLFERALTWASGQEIATAVDITLQVGSNNLAKLQTRVEIVGRPAL